jgi:hypothetical protein
MGDRWTEIYRARRYQVQRLLLLVAGANGEYGDLGDGEDRAIVGMAPAQDLLAGVGRFPGRLPEQRRPALVEVDLVGLDVPVPITYPSKALCALQTLLALA